MLHMLQCNVLVVLSERARDLTLPPQRGPVNNKQARRGGQRQTNARHDRRRNLVPQVLVHAVREEGERRRAEVAHEAVGRLGGGGEGFVCVGEVVAKERASANGPSTHPEARSAAFGSFAAPCVLTTTPRTSCTRPTGPDSKTSPEHPTARSPVPSTQSRTC